LKGRGGKKRKKKGEGGRVHEIASPEGTGPGCLLDRKPTQRPPIKKEGKRDHPFCRTRKKGTESHIVPGWRNRERRPTGTEKRKKKKKKGGVVRHALKEREKRNGGEDFGGKQTIKKVKEKSANNNQRGEGRRREGGTALILLREEKKKEKLLAGMKSLQNQGGTGIRQGERRKKREKGISYITRGKKGEGA